MKYFLMKYNCGEGADLGDDVLSGCLLSLSQEDETSQNITRNHVQVAEEF